MKLFKIHKSKDKKFYVTIQAKNGEILMTSEMLNSKQAAKKNIYATGQTIREMLMDDKGGFVGYLMSIEALCDTEDLTKTKI